MAFVGSTIPEGSQRRRTPLELAPVSHFAFFQRRAFIPLAPLSLRLLDLRREVTVMACNLNQAELYQGESDVRIKELLSRAKRGLLYAMFTQLTRRFVWGVHGRIGMDCSQRRR